MIFFKMDDEETELDDDILDEVGEDENLADDDMEGFGLIEEEGGEEDDEEEKDDEESDEESLEEDAEDVDFDTFDDVDEM